MIANTIPILGTALYISMPKNYYPDTTLLWRFSILHNLGLAIFSGYTYYRLCTLLHNDGWFQSGHMVYLREGSEYDSLIFWFYISKYYEYMDTFILYMNKKKPIFLQKYHHIGAVICWHLCYNYKVDAIIIGSLLNSGVHTVMYSYYLLSLYKIRLPYIKPWITIGQLVQLVSGAFITTIVYFPPIETNINYTIILLFDIYIIGLVYLFSDFYQKSYCKKDINNL
jgi:hypothetical protein